ncbi:zinc-binding alcohol dehydrogenase family protein [Kushneria avicenniae]|uniref:Zinc-type alcohol dehydrogenase-like protein n=1 Tax=Kushneria avicenniae TaxID=402385 RepID=A0A1I1G0H0_9GAMM|nr:zinc-binding alcohol dehydrogenase family protein [Kushneria avicenniae]SFC04806.1 zinc-binding alcohol dehydrogenase family protein [Kushneria avicenniae]
MKAIATRGASDITASGAFEEIEIERPSPTGEDILVRIEAVSVNPVDTKVRAGALGELEAPTILGWDATGIVEAIGDGVSGLAVGERVYYSGEVNRPGCNAQYQLIDSRLVAHAPRTLDVEEIAGMPLTALTAWEALFDKLRLAQDTTDHGDQTLLIINGAGGVGSIAIQMARQLTGIRVIATASRDQSAQWCREMGAHDVVDHHDLVDELKRIGLEDVDYIFNCHDIGVHWDNMVALIKPLGEIVAIAETKQQVDLNALQGKAASFHWEFMFARPLHDVQRELQGAALTTVARLLDEGRLRSTLGEIVGPLNVKNLTRAHQMLEEGHTIGKLVLTAMAED